jgi:transcriptional regulator with XRE-family HTH domain
MNSPPSVPETMPQAKTERPSKWRGGRVRYDRAGNPSYIIQKVHRDRTYYLTLDVATEPEALVQLDRFEEDREEYERRHNAKRGKLPPGQQPLLLDATLILDFQDFLRKNKLRQDGSGCSEQYILDAKTYLARWMDWLKGRDFRSVDYTEALDWLDKQNSARGKLINYIKSLGAWLRRRKGRLTVATDWTMNLVSVRSTSRKEAGAEAFPVKDVEELYRRLDDQMYRDILYLMAMYGMHYSEVQHLADSHLATIEDVTDSAPIAGLMRFWHKNSKWHPILLDVHGLGAARRLHDLPKLPEAAVVSDRFQRACGYSIDGRSKKQKVTRERRLTLEEAEAIRQERGKHTEKQAKKKAVIRALAERYGVSKITIRRIVRGETHLPPTERTLARVTLEGFRKTFVTLAGRVGKKVPFRGQAGLSLEDIVVVTGHSAETAKRYYDLNKIPPHMAVMPFKLKHPEDPSPLVLSAPAARSA